MGCQHDMMDATQFRATWPSHMTTGGSLTSRPPSQPHWHANDPPSPFLPHSNHATHTNQNLQVFMAQRDETSRSPQLQPTVLSTPLSISLAHFSQSDLPWAHSVLCSALQLWCASSIRVLELSGAYPPFWSFLVRTLHSFMPRPRGRPRRGAAWYQARGRKPPPSVQSCEASSPPRAVSPHCNSASPPPLAPMDVHPPEEGFPPPLTHLVIPSPSKPPVDPVTGLSPLSNPYDCRVEWFDLLGNSLGYAPPPPSPPRRPSFPPPPPHPSPIVSHSSPLLGSSSSSPALPPPFSF
jgi:hypothetical protein